MADSPTPPGEKPSEQPTENHTGQTTGQTTPITHGRILKIALPIVLSNATVPILGAVDTGVVGQLGLPAPIGAVGIGAIILTALYWVFGFLRMGTTGFAAQAHGAGDRAEVAALLTRALMIGLAAGLIIIALQTPLFAGAFAISPASPEVETLARQYMRLRIWSAPALISLYAVTGWLIAQERTRAVLAIQLLMNGCNIALDLWFVLGLGWGVQGVATATFIAEWAGLGLGLYLCRDAFATPQWRNWTRVLNRKRLTQMAAVNGDILLRSLMLQAIFVSFLFIGADFGDTTLAANQVLLQFLEITAYAMDGFAFGAETLVGQTLGARDRHALRRAALLSSAWGMAVGAALALAFFALGPMVIDLMTTSPPVRSEARSFLPYMIAAPLLGGPAWMLDGIFIGATRARDMRNMMALSLCLYAAAVLALSHWQNHGLWIAFLISFAARGLTLALRYPALEAAAAPGPRQKQGQPLLRA